MIALKSLLLGGSLLAVGIIIGVLFSSSSRNKRKQNKELLEKLEQSELQLQLYKQEVEHHFTRTAELVNAMTGSYQAVFEHLRQGASQLCVKQLSNNDNSDEVTQWPLLQQIDGPTIGLHQAQNSLDDYNDNEDDDDNDIYADHDQPVFPKDYSNAR